MPPSAPRPLGPPSPFPPNFPPEGGPWGALEAMGKGGPRREARGWGEWVYGAKCGQAGTGLSATGLSATGLSATGVGAVTGAVQVFQRVCSSVGRAFGF